MTQAKQGDTVKVHYTGKLENGEVFDTTVNSEPLEFTIGRGQLIPGFEEAVIGMDQGETKTAKVPAEKAYGQKRDDMILQIQRDQFPEGLKPQVGQELEVKQENGRSFPVRVTDVTENNVTLDANHPLAGEDLIFDIQLVEIS